MMVIINEMMACLFVGGAAVYSYFGEVDRVATSLLWAILFTLAAILRKMEERW